MGLFSWSFAHHLLILLICSPNLFPRSSFVSYNIHLVWWSCPRVGMKWSYTCVMTTSSLWGVLWYIYKLIFGGIIAFCISFVHGTFLFALCNFCTCYFVDGIMQLWYMIQLLYATLLHGTLLLPCATLYMFLCSWHYAIGLSWYFLVSIYATFVHDILWLALCNWCAWFIIFIYLMKLLYMVLFC